MDSKSKRTEDHKVKPKNEFMIHLSSKNIIHTEEKFVDTCTIVTKASCDVLINSKDFSQHLLKVPSIPHIPIPSTKSRVKRNGTVSGVGNIFPCSKATPLSLKRQTIFRNEAKDDDNVLLSRHFLTKIYVNKLCCMTIDQNILNMTIS